MVARAASDPLTSGGLIVMVLTSATIISNALLLQEGRHPAPFFSTRSATESRQVASPQIKTVAVKPVAVQPAESSELVRDIQTTLVEQGRYDGPIDGLAGQKTRAAIERFEKSLGLAPTGEATPRLLAMLKMSGAARGDDRVAATPAPAEVPKPKVDIETSQIAKVQKALNGLGYGPLEVDGLMGSATAGAVRRFELDRGLAITGELGPRVIAELKAIGGI